MKKNKALSWALSLVIHATGLVLILVAGFHLAAPEGTVTVDKVEFDAVGQSAPQAPPQAPSVPAPAPAPAPPESPKAESPPEPQEAAPPEKTVDEAPPLEAPSIDTEPDEKAPPIPQPVASAEDPTADTANEPSDKPAENANATPTATANPLAENQTPVTNSNPVTENPAPAPTDAGGSGIATQNGQGAATLDETKLTEAAGNHKPSYPYMARLRRQQGTVVLRAYVNVDGSVNQVTVATSSGFSSLDEEARTTYGRWKYQPGLTGWVIKPFKFSLK